MKIIMFCHPDFAASQSMPRFAQMLKAAYEVRGHVVELWSPRARVRTLFAGRGGLAKWAGYVDQYLVFPAQVRRRLRAIPADTLFVFCDQALGPWVPLVDKLPHVVHVHDLLALRSALGEIPENPTSLSGRIYQRYIRRGFRHARHFIPISKQSQADLYRVGGVSPVSCEVVYNGLNFPYAPLPDDQACRTLADAGLPVSAAGMLLHVGGAQWYKNRPGLIAMYGAYAARDPAPLPLWCIGPAPNARVAAAIAALPPQAQVIFLQNLGNEALRAAYSHARAFLFPSLAEGFGWPLIEAQACGCPVLTTDAAPMNEVAGDAASYIPRLNMDDDLGAWAGRAAEVLRGLLARSATDQLAIRERGLKWAQRFSMSQAIDSYLAIYASVLAAGKAQRDAVVSFSQSSPS